ncbi:MAG: hypothetical protein HY423_10330 [Candidatus Lambdaproteobacteria bacterium]|nr:hypothetical protein [Candidatus Lambdaproteobacteria bacterium]
MEFNKVMINALNLGTVRDVNDVVNIYKGLQRDSADDYDFRADMSRYLRRLLVALVNRDGVANDVDDKKINIWKYWVTEIIKKNEELAPFAGLPEAEKNILNDSVAFLDKGDHDAVRRKFSELVGVIKTRNEEFERNRLLNSLSIPLSIVGIILTIVFGVIGSISFFRTSSHKQSTA